MSDYAIPGGGWMVCYLDVETRGAISLPVVAWSVYGDTLFACDVSQADGNVGVIEFTGQAVVLWHPRIQGDHDGVLASHEDAARFLREANPAVVVS